VSINIQEVGMISVVVTTELRGVFFGYVDSYKEGQKTITITKARMCVFWDQTTKGVLGLAANGPNSLCRVGPAVPKISITKVSSIMETTEEAAKNWELGPWG
jgi:hypothetical protein